MRFEWADASPEADQYKVILESNIVFKPGTPKEEKEAISKIFFGEVNKADFETVDIRGIEIFTTRPDTLFGASFIALSPDHPLTLDMEQVNPKITDFRKQCAKIGTTEEAIATADKLGFDTGLRVKHPFDESKTLPVWIANFVLMGYGTGAVFGCPAHDQRDFDFATNP